MWKGWPPLWNFIRRSLSCEPRCRRSWMKTFVFVSIFTWNYAFDSIRVHVSVTIVKYNTLLRNLGKLLGEVVKWFWPSTLRKTITRRSARWTNGPCVGAGYERQPVITGHRPQKWRRGDSETKQKKKKKKNPSKYASRWICNHFLYIIQLNWLCLN